MSQRKSVNANVDKKVFKHTADKTKKINISPSRMRGGIRL